jgi:ABC-type dipeptide/oligopeptide/nickel transport system permease component
VVPARETAGPQGPEVRRLWGLHRFLKRLAGAVIVILGVVTFTFLLSRVFTASPVSLFVPQDASIQVRAQVRQQLGLSQPIIVQYYHFLLGIVHGNIGMSYVTGRPVATDLLSRAPATLELAVYALLIGIAAGVSAGVIAAVYRGRLVDHLVRLVTAGATSTPQFWVGLMLIWVFFVVLHIAPGPTGRLPIAVTPPHTITGFYVIDAALEGQWHLMFVAMRQLLLPVITLSVSVFAPTARTTRSAMVESLDADYIRTAVAMGVGRSRIWFQYALKNGLLSVLTILAGVIGWLFCGSVLAEGIFGWPGVGNYALTAIQNSDYPAIQGFVLYAAILYVVVLALLEFAYTVVDPRVRR